MKISSGYLVSLVKSIAKKMEETMDVHDIKLFFGHMGLGEIKVNYDYLETGFDAEKIPNIYSSVREFLVNIDSENLLKIAVELGIETPYFIASVPIIHNLFYKELQVKHYIKSFEDAVLNVYKKPDQSIALATTSLENIIKYIMDSLGFKYNQSKSAAELMQELLKHLDFHPKDLKEPTKKLAGGLITAVGAIQDIRDGFSSAHGKGLLGKTNIDDDLYSHFVVNSMSTIGLMLLQYYLRHIGKDFDEIMDEMNSYKIKKIENNKLNTEEDSHPF